MKKKNLTRNKQNQTTSVISFFSGCGGFDLGFIGDFNYHGHKYLKTNFRILHAYDNDKKCIETYRKNINRNIDILNLANYSPRNISKADILIGGFPCQDFATCGPRRGLTSNRGRLYLAIVKYMNEHSPKIVIGENVPGLANIHQGKILKTIQNDLTNAGTGYHIKIWKLYAPDFGVPQKRTRIFLVAVRNDIENFPIEPKPIFTKKEYRTTKWGISDLEKITDESIPNQSQYFKASKAKKGNGQGDEISCANEPAYTIRANAKSRIQFHYTLKRRLTVRECARLQTFPDSFKFPFQTTTNIMQIGNAVPPILSYQIAKSIELFLSRI